MNILISTLEQLRDALKENKIQNTKEYKAYMQLITEGKTFDNQTLSEIKSTVESVEDIAENIKLLKEVIKAKKDKNEDTFDEEKEYEKKIKRLRTQGEKLGKFGLKKLSGNLFDKDNNPNLSFILGGLDENNNIIKGIKGLRKETHSATIQAAGAQNGTYGMLNTGLAKYEAFMKTPWVMAVMIAVKVFEAGIKKLTEYQKLKYENLMKEIEAISQVTMNNIKTNLTSWKNSMEGMYASQDTFLTNQETILKAQNETELANLKFAHTWTNWIPIWRSINSYGEMILENEQKLIELRLQNAHKLIVLASEYSKLSDDYIKKQNKQMKAFQIETGMGSNNISIFVDRMLSQGADFAKFNKDIEDVLKMQSSYISNYGRNTAFSNEDNIKMVAASRVVGDENFSNFQSQMAIFNHSISDSADIMALTYKDISKLGLSQQKVIKNIVSNLKLANKYDFKNGIKGFIELSKWAENARFNMSTLGNMMEKVQTSGLEGVITQSAKLQVLGGNFALGADPLKMAYMGYSNPEEMAKHIKKMFNGFGRINPITGETEFSRIEQMQIRASSEALGMNFEDVKDMIREDNKKEEIRKQIGSNSGLTKEEIELIANRAVRNNETGIWEVSTFNGDRINVNDIENIKSNIDGIKSGVLSEDFMTYAQKSLSFEEELTATAKQIASALGAETYADYEKTQAESNELSLNSYEENNVNVVKSVEIIRHEALKKQNESLKNMVNLSEELTAALILTEKITRNLSEGSINTSIKEEGMKDSVFNPYKTKARPNNINPNNPFNGKSNSTAMTMVKNLKNSGINDGVVSSSVNDNISPLITADKVTPINDGSTSTLVSPNVKDTGIFAKDGGPFDTLFNGVFNKVNKISHFIESMSLPYTEFPKEIVNNNTDKNNNSSLKLEPLKVEISGNLQLKGNKGESIDLMKELSNNPMLIRDITKLISESISKKINGGRTSEVMI